MFWKELNKNLLNTYGDIRLTRLTFDFVSGPYVTDFVYDADTNCLAFVCDLNKHGTWKNIRDLKEFVSAHSINNDTLITKDTAGLSDNNNNIVRWVAFANGKMEINSKYDEDIVEELWSRLEYMNENDIPPQDVLKQAFDDGFTLKDFRELGEINYIWAQTIKEDYDLKELGE